MSDRISRLAVRYKVVQLDGKDVIEYVVDDLTNKEVQTHFNRAYVTEEWKYCGTLAKEAKTRGWTIDFTEEQEPIDLRPVPEEIIDDKSKWDISQVYYSPSGEMVNIYIGDKWIVFVRNDVVSKTVNQLIEFNYDTVHEPMVIIPEGKFQPPFILIPKEIRWK